MYVNLYLETHNITTRYLKKRFKKLCILIIKLKYIVLKIHLKMRCEKKFHN